MVVTLLSLALVALAMWGAATVRVPSIEELDAVDPNNE